MRPVGAHMPVRLAVALLRNSPIAVSRTLAANRNLLWELTKRDAFGRFRGSFGGIAWSLLQPVLLITVYTFVFSVVFNAKWGTQINDRSSFAIALFAGVIVHSLFAECLNRSAGLIVQQSNFVKRVIFPLEILPASIVFSSGIHSVLSLVVLAAFLVLSGTGIPWTFVLLPLAIVPLIIMSLGFSWIVAALGVYFRDLSQVIGLIATVLMFLSPVFYPVSAVPPRFQTLIYLNPLTYPIEHARSLAVLGIVPDRIEMAAALGLSLVVLWVGFATFQVLRRGFSDVL